MYEYRRPSRHVEASKPCEPQYYVTMVTHKVTQPITMLLWYRVSHKVTLSCPALFRVPPVAAARRNLGTSK